MPCWVKWPFHSIGFSTAAADSWRAKSRLYVTSRFALIKQWELEENLTSATLNRPTLKNGGLPFICLFSRPRVPGVGWETMWVFFIPGVIYFWRAECSKYEVGHCASHNHVWWQCFCPGTVPPLWVATAALRLPGELIGIIFYLHMAHADQSQWLNFGPPHHLWCNVWVEFIFISVFLFASIFFFPMQ